MSVLQDAYQLIQRGQLEDAKALLDAHRQDFQDNADYWWLVAHSTTDPEIGRAALGRVLLLDKDYPGARELDEEVRAVEQLASLQAPTRRKPLRKLPPMVAALVAGLIIVVIVGIGTAALLSGNQANTAIVVTDPSTEALAALATATSTEIGDVSASVSPTFEIASDLSTLPTDAAANAAETPTQIVTVPPVATPEPSATATPTLVPPTSTNTPSPVPPTDTLEPSPTATSTASPTASSTPLPTSATLIAQNQEPVFVNYEFMQGQLTPPNGVFLVGDLLSISLCAVPGIGAGNAVRDLLMTVSIGTAELDPTTRVIEIGIVDCDNNNQEQRVIAVARDRVEAYARGEITLQQLQQAVQPVR
jgi:hypothetical protein